MERDPVSAGVYAIESPSGGIYIGSAINIGNRRRNHFYLLRKNRHFSRGLQRAAIKYGVERLRFRTLLICRPEDCVLFEQRVIDAFGPKYNSRPVASSQLGMKHSAASKVKMSLGKIGRPVHSDEHKAALAQRMTGHRINVGRKHPDAERINRANALRGKHHKDGFWANLTDEKSEAITAAYRSGEGLVLIADRYRTNHKNIRKILVAAGLTIRDTRFGA